MLEELREEMYKCIEKYGLDHKITLEKSQKLDVLVVEKTVRTMKGAA